MAALTRMRPTIFYGWYVVVALGILLFLSAGLGFYAQGVFVTPLQDEFGWSRAQVSAAISISSIVSGVAGGIIGILLGRIRARALMFIGAAWMAVTLALLAFTPTLLYFYGVMFVMAAGRAAIMFVPTSVVISRWFSRRRGLAMGSMMTGIGFGGLVMAPASAVIIGAVGWRMAYGVLGALVGLVALPLIVLVVRESPADLNLRPDGDGEPDAPSKELGVAAGGASLEPEWTMREAWRTMAFVFIALAQALVFFTQTAVLLHVAPFLEDRGVSRQEAGLMLGFVSGAGVIGKLASGYLCDRVPPRLVLSGVFLMQALGLLIMLRVDSMAGVAAFVFVFGYAMGAVVALQPLVVVSLFGSRALATVMGGMAMATSLASGLGPVLAGVVRDGTGSYGAAFVTFILLDLLAAALILGARRPARRPQALPVEAAAPAA